MQLYFGLERRGGVIKVFYLATCIILEEHRHQIFSLFILLSDFYIQNH